MPAKKEPKDKKAQVTTSIKRSQLERLKKIFPSGRSGTFQGRGIMSKAFQVGIDMIIEAADEYGDEFILSIILDRKEYKIVRKNEF